MLFYINFKNILKSSEKVSAVHGENLAFPWNRKCPPVCLESAQVPLAEDGNSNSPKYEKEPKPKHFVKFVTRFSRAPLPTPRVLVLPLPLVCVYIKADQLSVCFSTGLYQETYAARGFQLAALPKQLPPSSSSWSGSTTLAAGTKNSSLVPKTLSHSLLTLPFVLPPPLSGCCSFLF